MKARRSAEIHPAHWRDCTCLLLWIRSHFGRPKSNSPLVSSLFLIHIPAGVAISTQPPLNGVFDTLYCQIHKSERIFAVLLCLFGSGQITCPSPRAFLSLDNAKKNLYTIYGGAPEGTHPGRVAVSSFVVADQVGEHQNVIRDFSDMLLENNIIKIIGTINAYSLNIWKRQ